MADAIPQRDFVDDLTFSPDGHTLLITTRSRVEIWQGAEESIVPLSNGESIGGAAFSPDGRKIVTWGQRVRVWDAELRQEIMPAIEHVDSVQAAAFSPDGDRLLTVTTGGAIRLWELTKAGFHSTSITHTGARPEAFFAPDGGQVVTINGELGGTGEARRWDVSSGKRIEPDLEHDDGVWGAACCDDGLLVTVSGGLKDKGTLSVWDARQGRRLAAVTQSRPLVRVAASADGSRIVTCACNQVFKRRSLSGVVQPKDPDRAMVGWEVKLWAWEAKSRSLRELAVLDQADNDWENVEQLLMTPDGSMVCVAKQKTIACYPGCTRNTASPWASDACGNSPPH